MGGQPGYAWLRPVALFGAVGPLPPRSRARATAHRVRVGRHPDTVGPGRPFLEELYESLLAQEDVTWEWIVAPNGPDADPDHIPSAIAKDARVRVVARPDPGPAPARNTALNFVRAPRVAFADDDDRLPPLALAIRNEHAITTGLYWVAGRSADWDPGTGNLTTWMCPTPVGRHAAGDVLSFWPDPMASKPPLGHCMLLTDTRLARAVGRSWRPPQRRGLRSP
jgi:glycosyltransferase involved in cell wall biosynthesis